MEDCIQTAFTPNAINFRMPVHMHKLAVLQKNIVDCTPMLDSSRIMDLLEFISIKLGNLANEHDLYSCKSITIHFNAER